MRIAGAELYGGRQQSGLQSYLQCQSAGKLFPLAIKGALVMHRQISHMVCQAPQHHLRCTFANQDQVQVRCNNAWLA